MASGGGLSGPFRLRYYPATTLTAQSIAGLTPSGAVTLNETVAAGVTGGTGALTFQGAPIRSGSSAR